MTTHHFNSLTEAEQERLVILAEECAEVIHIISKILRHGYTSFNPDVEIGPNNRGLLEQELADLLLAYKQLDLHGDIDITNVSHQADRKARTNTYIHHTRILT